MNSTLYIPRSREIDKRLSDLVKDQNLMTCYSGKKEKILKNEEMLLSMKKQYAFLKFFSEEYSVLGNEIQKFLFK